MKISAFTFIRNGSKLFYPYVESILSILDIVDEYVIAVGDCSEDDETLEKINAIGSKKIKIINTVWDLDKNKGGSEYARQTDIAKSVCTGDWLFYLQSDEVVHEDDLSLIVDVCKRHLNDSSTEGFLFKYLHFWGDYWHYHRSHAWYAKEIRIIRNRDDIHSWRDAQSFRIYNDFQGDYHTKKGTRKLKVRQLEARIFHYGYVRPPDFMARKSNAAVASYSGKNDEYDKQRVVKPYEYGPLNKIPVYEAGHPKVMEKAIKAFDWHDLLQYEEDGRKRPLFQHEKLKYRFLSFLECRILSGRQIGGFKNYQLIK